MKRQIAIHALKSFPVSDDGIHLRQIVAGAADQTIPEDLLEGLKAEGYVSLPDEASAPSIDITNLRKQKLNRTDLIKLADKLKVEVAADDTKEEIIVKIERSQGGQPDLDEPLAKLYAEFKAIADRPTIKADGQGADLKYVVTAPWSRVLVISKDSIDKGAPFFTTDKDSLLFEVANGGAEYELRGTVPDGELYELKGEPKYTAAT